MSQVKTNPNCPCPSDCPRHGNCDACEEHHSKKTSLPYCRAHPKS